MGKKHAVDSSPHGFEHFLEVKDWLDWLDWLGPKASIFHDETARNSKGSR
jgi:hypothetical protein